MSRISILGAGSFGCALAILLNKNQNQVCLWGRESSTFSQLKRKRQSSRYLKKYRLPLKIQLTSSLTVALEDTDLIVLATPTQATRTMAQEIKSQLSSQIPLVSMAKGFETKTCQRNSEILKENLGSRYPILVMSGPSHAEEIAAGLPCSLTLACRHLKMAHQVGPLFHSSRFRVYYSQDMVGVEIGGALKNIMAIASGICDGLGLGDNAKAALITRGLVEIKRFGKKEGAKASTFDGLSGLGDLITTCSSPFSRNRQVGEDLGKGKKIKAILKSMSQVAEGIPTTSAVVKRARQIKIEMPITQQVETILQGRRSPRVALENLMARAARDEF